MTEPNVNPKFVALADSTRRQLLDQISRQGPLSATELAAGYPMSRQAVAKHLSALVAAGLLTGDRQGRDVRYRVSAAGLDDAARWLTEVGDQWDLRLNALQRLLAGTRRDDRPDSATGAEDGVTQMANRADRSRSGNPGPVRP